MNNKAKHFIIFISSAAIVSMLLFAVLFSSNSGMYATPTSTPTLIQVETTWTPSPTGLPTITPDPLLPTLPVLISPTPTVPASSANYACSQPLNLNSAGLLKNILVENNTNDEVTLSLELHEENQFGECGTLSYTLSKDEKQRIKIPTGFWFALGWAKGKNEPFIGAFNLEPNKPDDLLRLIITSEMIRLSDTIDMPQIMNPPQPLQAAFNEIDSQFKDLQTGNIAFSKPEQMKKDETASVELILSPSLSQSALATQVVERGGFETSTAEPSVLIDPNGEEVTVTTSQIEITPRMKAVLLSQDPEAFIVENMHDNAEQVVSSVETTAWRWSVTAKKKGSQTLELIIYQLVKYEGKDYWHEVETYKADIVVKVTFSSWMKSLDWKWILGFILTFVGSVLGVLTWLSNSRKKAEEEKPIQSLRKKKQS